MTDLQFPGGAAVRWQSFPYESCVSDDGAATGAGRGYVSAPLSTRSRIHEPRKTYNKPRKRAAGTNPKAAYPEDIFTRLDRLRSNADPDSIVAQLDRLQAIAALMQQRDQGPMPGEMLRVYAWEVEDAVNIIKKNSGVGIRDSE